MICSRHLEDGVGAPKGPGMRIGVIGPDTAGADPVDLTMAEEVGHLLGEHGATVVCGGLGGVMEAVCRGAAAHGATTVGLLPGRDDADANLHLTVALPTGVGELRNALIVTSSQAVISIGGSWGTLSEIALALRTGTPCVALRSWRITPHAEPATPAPLYVDTPAAAVAAALEAINAHP